MKLAIDHLGVAGRDIDLLADAYKKMGFLVNDTQTLLAATATGATREIGQRSAHIMFGSSYLELTAVAGDLEGHHLQRYLQVFAGAHILALALEDAESAAHTWRSRGLAAGAVRRAQRKVAYGDRKTAHFKWCQVDVGALPGTLLCGVEHVTPEVVFQPSVTTHPNGALGYAGIRFYADNPGAAALSLRPLQQAEGLPVAIADDLAIPGDQPLADGYLAEMTFYVESIGALMQLFESNGVAFIEAENQVMVSNRIAAGAGLIFKVV